MPSGSPADAEQHSRQAVQRLPSDSDAWCALGDVCANSGRTQAALDCYENALRATPTHRAALLARANLLWQTQRTHEALAALRQLVQVGQFDEALAILADVRRTLPAQAAAQLDTLIEQFRRGEALRVPPSYP